MGFGQKVRQLRIAQRITQRQLAELIGVNFTYISRIENDRLEVPPSEQTIRKIADVLNSDFEALAELAGKIDSRKLQNVAMDEPDASFTLRRIQDRQVTKEQWKQIRTILDGQNKE